MPNQKLDALGPHRIAVVDRLLGGRTSILASLQRERPAIDGALLGRGVAEAMLAACRHTEAWLLQGENGNVVVGLFAQARLHTCLRGTATQCVGLVGFGAFSDFRGALVASCALGCNVEVVAALRLFIPGFVALARSTVVRIVVGTFEISRSMVSDPVQTPHLRGNKRPLFVKSFL